MAAVTGFFSFLSGGQGTSAIKAAGGKSDVQVMAERLSALCLERAGPAQLSFIQRRVLAHMPEGSALGRQLQASMSRCDVATQLLFSQRRRIASSDEVEKVKQGVVKLPKAAPSVVAVYRQGNHTNEEAIAYLKQHGAALQKVTLTDVSNELLEAVVAHCTALQSFSIKLSEAIFITTEIRLDLLLKLTTLSELRLNIWNIFYTTHAQLVALFSDANLQANLRTVSVESVVVDEEILRLIGQFKSLKNVNIYSVSLQPDSVAAFIKAQPNLESLALTQGGCWGPLVDDAVLGALGRCKALQRLSLYGGWQDGAAALPQALKGMPALQQLEIIGHTLTPAGAKAIGALPALKRLYLSDCAKLENHHYEVLLQQIATLESVALQKCYGLQDLTLFKRASKLRGLTLFDCGSLITELKGLCEMQNLQSGLQELTLGNNGWIASPDFGHLKNLANLETLRLIHCSTFNDTSMRELWGGHNGSRIKSLELNGAGIADDGLLLLNNVPLLQVLMLGNLNAVTADGFGRLLKSSTMRQELVKLYVDKFVVTPEIVPLFGAFEKLQTLVIGNPMQLPYDDQGAIFKVQPLRERNVSIEEFWGELASWRSFNQM